MAINPLIEQRPELLVVHSPAVGNYELGGTEGVEGALREVLQDTPAGIRSSAINNVSTSPHDAILPRVERFSRQLHVADLGRLMMLWGRAEGWSEAQILDAIVREHIVDLAHGPESHVSDMAVEGSGGGEVWHDSRGSELLAVGGVGAVLERAGHQSLTVPLPTWAAGSSPDFNLDNAQYTLAEGRLLFSGSGGKEGRLQDRLNGLLDPAHKRLSIRDGRFVFADKEDAEVVARLNLVLSREHWSSVYKRAQLYFRVGRLRHSIMARLLPDMDNLDGGHTRNPLSYFDGIDSDLTLATERSDELGETYLPNIATLLTVIGRESGRRFERQRETLLGFVLGDYNEYPAADSPSSTFAVSPAAPGERGEARNGPMGFTMKPLKVRYLRPEYLGAHGEVKTLGAPGDHFARLVDNHLAALHRTHFAELTQPSAAEAAALGLPAVFIDGAAMLDQTRHVRQAFFAAVNANREVPEHNMLSAEQRQQAIAAAALRAQCLPVKK